MSVTYLDAAVAAPVHPLARQALDSALDEGWADPRRLHRQGRHARLLLENARAAIAAELGARTEEVIFTGSYESAVHAAVLGVRQARRRIGFAVVASAIEHSAVLQAADWSEPGAGRAGQPPVAVRIGVDRAGAANVGDFAEAVRDPGVVLACLQAANAEVGTVQPISAVAAHTRDAGVPLLMDATAVAGHAPLPAEWDILVADPRSWGAPAGLGVLVGRAGTRWTAPGPPDDGTEAVPGLPSVPLTLAAAVALQRANQDRVAQHTRRRALLARIRAAAQQIPDTDIAGDPGAARALPHVLTFSCLYVDGEAVIGELDRLGFAAGSGSACTASTLEPSHVLAAMGLLTHGNIRIGLPMDVGEPDVARFCEVLPGAIASVRAMLGASEL